MEFCLKKWVLLLGKVKLMVGTVAANIENLAGLHYGFYCCV